MSNSKKESKTFEINNAEELLVAFKAWRDLGAEGRKASIAAKGESERRITVQKELCKISFYDTGAVYVGFRGKKDGKLMGIETCGRWHTVKLQSGYNPRAEFTNGKGVKKTVYLTWDCTDYYSMGNKKLATALGEAF